MCEVIRVISELKTQTHDTLCIRMYEIIQKMQVEAWIPFSHFKYLINLESSFFLFFSFPLYFFRQISSFEEHLQGFYGW